MTRVQPSNWPWSLGKLPFYYAPLRLPTNGDLPDALPFALDIDLETGTLVQTPSDTVTDALSRAYSKGSMVSGMMDEEGIGKEYAEDFLSFLTHVLEKEFFDHTRVLEVGCGTGYLLYRLKQLGGDVLGLEPGAHGQEGSTRFHIPIIRDFFPSARIDGKFDVIILYGVLEHVQGRSDFLARLLTYLEQKGSLLISVPDEEPYLEVGDVSMLYCEHWSYYTEKTLRNSVKKFTGMEIDVERSSFGGSLYAIAHTPSTTGSVLSSDDVRGEVQRLLTYRHLVEKRLSGFLGFLRAATSKGESLGIYIPSRAINALSILRERIDLSRMRFFDDNESLHGTYFPGFDIPIESRENLISNPPDRVLVMSHSFGRRIAKELVSSVSKQLVLTTWEELFRG